MALPKLLFYTHGLVDGGAERLWATLATAFKERGHEVIFAVDYEAFDNRASLDPAIPLTVLGRNHGLAIARLARLIGKEKPDVALSAVAGSNLKIAAAAALARQPTPIIASYHGFEEWNSGHASYLAYKLLPVFGKRLSRIVAVSDELATTLIERWHADAGKMRVLLNPVFAPGNARLTADELGRRPDVILAAGRLVPEKNFGFLIRAFAKLNRPGARLVILGKGPDEALLRREILRLGLGDRVTLAGYCREPWPYYDGAKCLAVSSRTESFGNVIVEAMAHGLPVVATDCAGPNEILDRGRFGRIIAQGDEDTFAAALGDVLDRPGDPVDSRARAAEYSFGNRLPAYASLIAEVAAEAKLTALRPARRFSIKCLA